MPPPSTKSFCQTEAVSERNVGSTAQRYDLRSPQVGDMMVWDGTRWVPTPTPAYTEADRLRDEDHERWIRRLMRGAPDDVDPPALEGAHPYRGGGTAQTASEAPKGFWRGAWERLLGLLSR